MGIVIDSAKRNNHILTKYGFKYSSTPIAILDSQVCGYQKCFCGSLYCVWFSVNVEKKKISTYVEYDCGGEVYDAIDDIPDEAFESAEELLMWVDEYCTNVTDTWLE